MKKEDKKLTWYNVTLRQFQLLQELIKIEDENERVISVAELIFGSDVTNLTISEFNQKVKQMEFLKDALPDIVPPKNVEVNGRKYYIDSLLGKITTAQYVDFTNHAKGGDICKMMSVFLIPEGHKYNDGYDIEQVFSDIEDLPIPVVNSTAFFFKRQLEVFMKVFQRYSIRNIRKTKLPKKAKKAAIEVVQKSVDMVLYPTYYGSVK